MVGIDTSKRTLHASLRDPSTRDIIWDMEVQNSSAGIDLILDRAPADVPWVIEPTGRYSIQVVVRAQQAGRTVKLAPPRKAKLFLASLQNRAKTDKLDSKGLSLYGLSQPLALYPIKEATLDTLDQLLSGRKSLSGAISRLQLQSSELPSAREGLERAIAVLKVELKEMDKRIKAQVDSDPKVAIASKLQEVPGIGAVTAAAVASRLAGKRFSHPDQFVAYIGLDITVRESGMKKGRRGLTRQGDCELRRLLYCCAQASLRAKDSPFRAQYEREKSKGLTTSGALCAVARKMAKLCWSLHRHNGSYDAARVYSPDKSASASSQKAEVAAEPSAGH